MPPYGYYPYPWPFPQPDSAAAAAAAASGDTTKDGTRAKETGEITPSSHTPPALYYDPRNPSSTTLPGVPPLGPNGAPFPFAIPPGYPHPFMFDPRMMPGLSSRDDSYRRSRRDSSRDRYRDRDGRGGVDRRRERSRDGERRRSPEVPRRGEEQQRDGGRSGENLWMTELAPPSINIEATSPGTRNPVPSNTRGGGLTPRPGGSTTGSSVNIQMSGADRSNNRSTNDAGDMDAFSGMNAKERRMAQRRCIAEDKEWNLALVEKLSELCLRVIVTNFEKSHKFLNGIPRKHRERVLSSVSVNLPLSIAAALIPDESYWKRRVTSHFKNCDPNSNTANRAIGNGIGGFGGGLMELAPLVGPVKVVSSPAATTGNLNTEAGMMPRIGLSQYPITSVEDIWMGFGAGNPAASSDNASVHAVAPAAGVVDTPGGVSAGGLGVGLGAASTRQASFSSQSVPGEAPAVSRQATAFGDAKPKGDKYVKPAAIDAGKWKTLFFELHLQNLVEAMSPKKVGGLEELAEPLEGEIVKPTDPPSDHLDISFLINELVYLRDLKIYYGVRDCGINFSWRLFGMTLNDSLFLSSALKTTTSLETLIIQASGIDDDRCRLIASALLENRTVRKLDLSHNKIGDSGARGIAKILAAPNSLLTHLDISNNQIKQTGAHSIGKALQVNSTLIHLNMRMNRLGDSGGADFCVCLTKVVALPPNYKPPAVQLPVQVAGADGVTIVAKVAPQIVQSNLCSLDMASNGLGMETVQALCVLLKKGGKNLRILDFSCNKFGDCGAPKANAIVAVLPGSSLAAAGKAKGEQDLAGKLLFEAVSQNKITYISTDVHPSESAIIVNYYLQLIAVNDNGKQTAGERKAMQKSIKVKVSEDSDVTAIAREIIEKYPKLIPAIKMRDLEAGLSHLQQRGPEVRSKSRNQMEPEMNPVGMNASNMLDAYIRDMEKEDNSSLDMVEQYIEGLYEEMPDKIASTRSILSLAKNPQNLDVLMENDSLISAISRVLREDNKKSMELVTNIIYIFFCFSNYPQYHPFITANKVGDMCLRITDQELNRFNIWSTDLQKLETKCIQSPENAALNRDLDKEHRKFQAMIRKQDQLLFVCFHLLLNLAEDLSIEVKMVKRDIVRYLTTILDRETPELLVLTLTFLKKLSVFKENKDELVQSDAVFNKVEKILSIQNQALQGLSLKLLLNLSHDKGFRTVMVRNGCITKISDLLNAKVHVVLNLQLLYQISIDEQNREVMSVDNIVPQVWEGIARLGMDKRS
ncbi:Kinesin-associated protein 3 [Podochytrium sp. JEL0797]|nr:Kinesin-associated protein 3 [Podochytrium sp. JEL0797]